MDNVYAKAEELMPGRAICNAGYLDCPYGNDYHWHCANCGGVTGQMGHYGKPPGAEDWGFSCEKYPPLQCPACALGPSYRHNWIEGQCKHASEEVGDFAC